MSSPVIEPCRARHQQSPATSSSSQLIVCALAAIAFGTARLPAADGPAPSIAAASVDTAACRAYIDGQPAGQPSAAAINAALGLADGAEIWQATGPDAAKRRDFLIAFHQPVTIGTLCTATYTGPEKQVLGHEYGRFIAVLKPAAPYPGDVANESQWLILPGGEVKVLTPPAVTRALRITTLFPDPVVDSHWAWNARLAPLLCLQSRCFNALDTGAISHRGGEGTDQPDEWILDWRAPRSVLALVAQGRPQTSLTVAALKETVLTSPTVAEGEDWQVVATADLGAGLRLVPLESSAPARALRLSGPPAQRNGTFGFVVPLVALGADDQPPELALPLPPVRIAFEMPFAGVAALQIHDRTTGRLVRRLYAEIVKPSGANVDTWDLKDEAGLFVAPGAYTWRAMVRPPFELTYEMTAYNAGQPAWWAPVPGKGGGGWLADHGTPNCAAEMGDLMWFGSQCAENGHVAIATDLEGNKLWGTHHIAYGFRGPSHIACGTDAAYLIAGELINRVVPADDFAMRTVFTCRPTREMPWNPAGYDANIGGAAVRDGKLYWSINAAPESWMQSSFAADLIDAAHCLPGIGLIKGRGHRSERDDEKYDESEYDELMRLYAAFLTGRTPVQTPTLKDLFLPSSTQAYFGDGPDNGEFANSVVVVFKEPVTVGSVLVPDGDIRVYALRPGADAVKMFMPKSGTEIGTESPATNETLAGLDELLDEIAGTDDGSDRAWQQLVAPTASPGRPGVVVAPPGGLKTTALRYRTKRLIYSQVIPRRLQDCVQDAQRVVTEGVTTASGGWQVARPAGQIFNANRPATMALIWPAARELRGLTFSYPLLTQKGGRYVIDRYVGDGDPAAALAVDDDWQPVIELEPEPVFAGWFAQTPTCRHADFGRIVTARALRLRLMSGVDGEAGFAGVIAWTPLGDDPDDLPVYLNERVTVLDLPAVNDAQSSAVVNRHIPLPKPGELAFSDDGKLYAVSDGRVVRIPLPDGDPQVVVAADKLKDPRGLDVDDKGLLYVADGATRTIKVFDPQTGTQTRTIGAGPQRLGAWDAARLDNPMQIAVDKLGRLWVADATYQPKRVQRFTAEGQPDRHFLGPTQYGGGGWLDEGDRSRIYYSGMRFILDWDRQQWRLDALIARGEDLRSLAGAAPPDRAVYCQGKRYLVGPVRMGDRSGIANICREEDDRAVPLAAVGMLSDWGDIARRDDLRQAFGALDGSKILFCWWDRNGDGQPQATEVQTTAHEPTAWVVGEDLAFYATGRGTLGQRLRPTGIGENGVPAYDLETLETFHTYTHGEGARTTNAWGTADGRIFLIGTRLVAADGKTQVWEYYNEFARHEGFYHSGFGYDRPPGVLNQEHKIIGHFRVGAEEFFVTNTDQGDWFCYTGDGMFAGCIFGGPAGYGLRRWTMPVWTPGQVSLNDVRLGQEHYQGCIVKADDGKVYAVAGHNHMSIVRVDGLERLQRLEGEVKVTTDDLAKTRDWQVQRSAIASVRTERKATTVPFLPRELQIDGELTAWPPDLFVIIHDSWQRGAHTGPKQTIHARGALAYSKKSLFVAARVLDPSPLANAAQDPVRAFQHGDAVDVTLGLDPAADPNRTSAAGGDVRIIFAVVRGKPVAVLYRPVAPDAPAEEHARFESPVGMTLFDQVRILSDAEVGVKIGRDIDGQAFWQLTAAVPWSALNVEAPTAGPVLRGDIGVLQSDPNGVTTASRLYWSGKSQTVVCDVPSETRLVPALWGELHFAAYDFMNDSLEVDFAPTQPTDAMKLFGD